MKETDITLVNEVLPARGAALECLLNLTYFKNDLKWVRQYLSSLKEAAFSGKVGGLPDGDIVTFFNVLTVALEELQAFYSQNQITNNATLLR